MSTCSSTLDYIRSTYARIAGYVTYLGVVLTALSWRIYLSASAFIGVEVMLGLLSFTAMLPSIPFIIVGLGLVGFVWQKYRSRRSD
ncbi:hypothetical protein [Gordonia sp. NPDC003429]